MTKLPKHLACGMAAVILSACGGGAPATDDRAAAQRVTSVAAVEVARGDVQTWVFGEGTARALHREFLSFESAGRIAYVDPNLKEGDSVEQGQLIAYQEKNRRETGDDTAQLSHAAVRDAEANLELAQRTYDRFAALLEQRSASQQEYDEARARLEQARIAYQNALIVADESRIVAPIDGVLARLNIEQGYYFSPQQIQSTSEAGALNTVPVVIIDSSAFEVSVSLPSFVYRQIDVGARVFFQQDIDDAAERAVVTGADYDGAIQGVVYAVSPSVDPDTRTFSVKLRTTNGAEHLQDGAFVYAWIAGPAARDVLTIPRDALRFENNAPYVFRVDSENVVSRVAVTLGLEGREGREVLAGLSEGDIVVTDGRSRLANGDAVRIVAGPGRFDERLQ